jgi:hypothetical protein
MISPTRNARNNNSRNLISNLVNRDVACHSSKPLTRRLISNSVSTPSCALGLTQDRAAWISCSRCSPRFTFGSTPGVVSAPSAAWACCGGLRTTRRLGPDQVACRSDLVRNPKAILRLLDDATAPPGARPAALRYFRRDALYCFSCSIERRWEAVRRGQQSGRDRDGAFEGDGLWAEDLAPKTLAPSSAADSAEPVVTAAFRRISWGSVRMSSTMGAAAYGVHDVPST